MTWMPKLKLAYSLWAFALSAASWCLLWKSSNWLPLGQDFIVSQRGRISIQEANTLTQLTQNFEIYRQINVLTAWKQIWYHPGCISCGIIISCHNCLCMCNQHGWLICLRSTAQLLERDMQKSTVSHRTMRSRKGLTMSSGVGQSCKLHSSKSQSLPLPASVGTFTWEADRSLLLKLLACCSQALSRKSTLVTKTQMYAPHQPEGCFSHFWAFERHLPVIRIKS